MSGLAYRCDACRTAAARCTACRARANAKQRALRARRRQAGDCLHCTEPAVDDGLLCAEHRDANNATSSAAHIARRARERTA